MRISILLSFLILVSCDFLSDSQKRKIAVFLNKKGYIKANEQPERLADGYNLWYYQSSKTWHIDTEDVIQEKLYNDNEEFSNNQKGFKRSFRSRITVDSLNLSSSFIYAYVPRKFNFNEKYYESIYCVIDTENGIASYYQKKEGYLRRLKMTKDTLKLMSIEDFKRSRNRFYE